MIGLALVGLAVIGVVVSWDKQLPSTGERWAELSRRRRVLSWLAIPAGLLGVVLAAVALAASNDPEGAYEALALVAIVAVGIGGLSLVFLAMSKVWRSRR